MARTWTMIVGVGILLANWTAVLADEGAEVKAERALGRRDNDPHWLAIKKAADAKDYPALVKAAEEALKSNSGLADYHNMYAYGLRNLPNPDMAKVFMHYNEALRRDPWHVGAHEYLGEAYLMTGNVAKAKEHLERVRLSCGGTSCAEYKKLAAAIDAKK